MSDFAGGSDGSPLVGDVGTLMLSMNGAEADDPVISVVMAPTQDELAALTLGFAMTTAIGSRVIVD